MTTNITDRQKPMTWSEASREYFLGNPKTKAKWMLLLPRLLLRLARVFPPLGSFVLIAEDIPTMGIGLWNDIFVIPLAAWTFFGIRRFRNASRH